MKIHLQGRPFSPVCFVTSVFPTIFGMTSLTCWGVVTTCTPPWKSFSLKKPRPLPPVWTWALTAYPLVSPKSFKAFEISSSLKTTAPFNFY